MDEPICTCGHECTAHDYAGDEHETSWGVCEVPGCDCRRFTEDV